MHMHEVSWPGARVTRPRNMEIAADETDVGNVTESYK